MLAVCDLDLLLAFAQETGVEGRWLGAGEMSIYGPILLLLECFDFTLALDDQSQGDGLHSPGGKTAANFVPKQRRNLVTDEAVQNPAGLLCVDQVLVDVAGMLERFLYGALCNLVEGDPADALATFVPLFLLFLFLGAVAQLLSQMRGNRLTLAVRVRRQVNCIDGQSQLFQLGYNLFLAGNHDVLGLETILNIHPESTFGQIFDVAERGLDSEALAQVFLDGLHLPRRLNDN